MLKNYVLAVLAMTFMLLVGPTTAASVPQAQPDKGLVVFYRNKSMKGSAIHMLIQSSEGAAGNLKNGTVFHQYYDPGTRTFDVSTPSIAGSDLVTIDIQPGGIYFIRGEILLGWPAGRPKLTIEPESTARAEVDEL